LLVGLAAFFALLVTDVIGLDPRTPTQSIVAGVTLAVLIVAGGLVGVAVFIRKLDGYFTRLLESVDEISGGNLSPELPTEAPAELGQFANALETMCGQLRMVLSQLSSLSTHVVDSTKGAGKAFHSIQDGTALQSRTATRTFEAVSAFNDGLLETSSELDVLATRIERSAANIIRMDTAIGHVTQMIGGLSETIEQASESTRGGDANAQRIGRDIADLAAQVHSAKTALSDVVSGSSETRAHAGDAAFIMGNLENETERIGEAIEATIQGSDAVNRSNLRILEVTASLESRVDQVDSVLETVHNLAERTKLLSINASIIASEAGEHGRAFAVVAHEIKDLAQSTASAIAEIARVVSGLKDGFSQTVNTIQTGQQEIDRGISLARNAVGLLRSIPEEVSQASALSTEIVARTESQVEKGTQVSHIIGQVVTTLASVGEVLEEQITRNARTLALFKSIDLTAGQVLVSTKDHADASGSVARDVESISNEFRRLAGQVRENLTGIETLVGLSQEVMSTTDANRERAENLSKVIDDLGRFALYLGEDFRKLSADEHG
jgi:methyl-accepting chemotaxis protein